MSEEYILKSNVIWGNINLYEYNAFAFSCNIFERAERDISAVSVPGRSGDLLFDNRRYKNVDRVYHIQVTGVKNAMELLSALSAQIGYWQLRDEYEPDVYMEARIKGKPKVNHFVGDAVSITLTLDRKPYKHLLDVPEKITYTSYCRMRYGSYYIVVAEYIIAAPVETRPLIEVATPYGYYYQLNIFRTNTRLSLTTDATWSSERDAYLENSFIEAQYKHLRVYERVLEIDSENRTYVFRAATETSDYFNVITDFPVIKKGLNYFYITFRDPERTGNSPPTASNEVPVIYPRYKRL